MNDDDLPGIAEKAINSVLRYHDEKHTSIGSVYQKILNDRIAELLPARLIAADHDATNVEIVSDAAMSCLDLYNREHRDNPVDEKWMYIGVQCLACLDLKPSLVCGIAPRLPVPNAPYAFKSEPITNNSPGVDGHASPQQSDTEGHTANGSEDVTQLESPIALRPAALKRDRSTLDEPSSNIDSEDDPEPVKTTPRAKKRRSSGPQVANGKEAWGDEEITKLIKWKAQGMTHKEIGAILGRTEPACAIRHSIVLKQERWNNFAREYREKRAAGGVSDEEGDGQAREMGEKAKGGEEFGPVEEPGVAAQPEILEAMEMPQLEDDDPKDDSSRDEDPRDEDYKE